MINQYYPTEFNLKNKPIGLGNRECYKRTDSIIYKYDTNLKEMHAREDAYIQTKYDNLDRLIEYNQIAEKTNEILFTHRYKYTDKCKIGDIQEWTFDGIWYRATEETCYDSLGKIISYTKKLNDYISKIIFNYNENGIIQNLKKETLLYDSTIESSRSVNFNIKCNLVLDKKAIDLINTELLDKELD